MVKIFKWLGWFALCAVLQSTLVPYAAIFSVKPDLLMLAFFFLVIKAGVLRGVYAGFFLGLGLDLFSPSLLGQNALAFSVTGFVFGHFNERVMRLDPIMQAVLMIAMFAVNDSIVMLVHVMKAGGAASAVLTELLAVTLPRAIYTLIVAAVPLIWINVFRPPRLVD